MEGNDFDPYPNAWPQMWGHIIQKGFQLGSVIAFGAAPILAYRGNAWPAIIATSGKTAAVGVAFSVTLGAWKLHDQDLDAVADRVYRLHYNVNQNRTDTFSQVGAAMGVGVGAALGAQGALPLNVWTVLGSGAIGAACGVMAHGATAPPKQESSKKRDFKSLVKEVKDSVDKMG